jgi:hypothetical protein
MNKLLFIPLIAVLVSGLILGGCAKPAPTTTPVPVQTTTPASIPAPATTTVAPIPTSAPPPSPTPTPTPTTAPAPTPTPTPTPTSAPSLNLDGTWSSSNNQSAISGETIVIVFHQSGVSFNGTWNSSKGYSGIISGNVTGYTLNFTIAINNSGNVGTFVATGIVDNPGSSQLTMTFSYEGIISGVRKSGLGQVVKQK